ncbi:MAG: hypothetical protein NT062_08840 [Proteobacteria bacterium]|nr:hypothetical protein [Pseudomonadota bacterium]
MDSARAREAVSGNGLVPVTVATLIPAGLSFGIVNDAVRLIPGALDDARPMGRLIVIRSASTCVAEIFAYAHPARWCRRTAGAC